MGILFLDLDQPELAAWAVVRRCDSPMFEWRECWTNDEAQGIMAFSWMPKSLEEFSMNDPRLKFSMTEAISGDQRLSNLIQTAHQLLLDTLGPSAVQVQEDWSLEKDLKGRPLILLRLSDFTGGVKAAFAPDELDNPREMRYRLHRLWGDLLQDRSHKQLRQLVGADESEGGRNGP